MLKKNRRSENDLVNFYYSCLLFKKYYQYNLWFGNFSEYDNIKYCKNYIQKYIYYWISIFLLKRFSLSLVIFLYKSPCFTKFVVSGFFKYLNYHFLLSFYSNCFTFDLKGKQKIKIFVKSYFQNFVKKHLEKDLLILIIEVINIKLNYNKILSINLKSVKASKLIMEKFFIRFPRKTLYHSNKDVQSLLEFVEILGGLNEQETNIGLYKNSSIIFKGPLIQKFSLFNKTKIKTFKKKFKSFNLCFVKSYKI